MNDVDEARGAVVEITHVEPGSVAEEAGIVAGDGVVSVNGMVPRDILEWKRAVADDEVILGIVRDGEFTRRVLRSEPGRPLGLSVSSAVFDRVHTCDNHCEFCFIYQLPKGMRRSLYLKDDDYRLSFLFGNFTTLTRFTEADLERVVAERLSPLHVSVHATDPWVRAGMLRNDRGGTSLRWLSALLDAGVDVRLQIVLCPGVNSDAVLDDTLAGILERHHRAESVAIVPLGLSRHNTEARMRVHTRDEAAAVVERVARWQERFLACTGRRVVHVSDELHVLAGVPVPPADAYDGFPMLEDGVGMVRSFVDSFLSGVEVRTGAGESFFAAVDARTPSDYVRAANPASDTAMRAVAPVQVRLTARKPVRDRIVILTGTYGRDLLSQLVRDRPRVEVREVENLHFGGNTAVAGLLTFADIVRSVVPGDDAVHLLPASCLNEGRFLDGRTIEELARIIDVEVVPVSGAALRHRLDRVSGAGE